MSDPELSIVMPCLNEFETVGSCVQMAHLGAKRAGVHDYEIIVADNGSTDGSQSIAASNGAIVIDVPIRGYGSALSSGIQAAKGKYILMGDADSSYDFSNIKPFLEKLREGYQLVMGTRLKGIIKPKAMPFLHRYLGNPILTFIGNLFFKAGLSDFHCGMRAFDREAILSLNLQTLGMEYASEMVVRASLKGLSRCEIPITYSPAGRSRKPHLRTYRDGWRHLRFMLLFSPRWLFLYPGILILTLGLAGSSILLAGPVRLGSITLDTHTLLAFSMTLIVGLQLILLALFTQTYASQIGMLPMNSRTQRFLERFTLEHGLILGAVIGLIGLGLYGIGIYIWSETGFGPLPYIGDTLRIIIAGTVLVIISFQVLFSSFTISLLGIQRR